MALISAAHAADIGLSPPKLELVVAPGSSVTETVSLFTDAKEEQVLSVSKGDWVQNIGGQLSFLPAESTAYSASPWLEFAQDIVVIPAEDALEFRVSVSVPDSPELGGTYQTVIFFETTPQANDSEGVQVVTRQRVGLIVYVTVAGTERGGAELLDLYQDGRYLNFVVANLGNTLMRLGGRIELRDEAGQTAYTLTVPALAVLRESEREVGLLLPDDIEPGFYIALSFIEDGRGEMLIGELPLTID